MTNGVLLWADDEKVFDEIVKECALDYYHKWKGHWYAWK